MLRLVVLVAILVVLLVLVVSWVRAAPAPAGRREETEERARQQALADLQVHDARADQVAARLAETWRDPSAHLLDTATSARLVETYETCTDAGRQAREDPTPHSVEVYAAALVRVEEALEAAREEIRRRELGG